MFISADELSSRIGEQDLAIVDCFYNLHEYRRGHIPGAIKRIGSSYVKAGTEENPGLHYPKGEEFEERMNAMGIGPNTTVVAYDSDGSLFAARFLLGLIYYGHDKVLLLNGGWQSWIDAKYPVSVTIHEPKSKQMKFKANMRSELVVSKQQLLTLYDDPSVSVIDVRRKTEYHGTDNRGNSRSGRIPGAIHMEWTELLESTNTTEDLSNVKAREEILQLMKEKGIDTNNNLITYCQGGVRASLVAYILRYLGIPKVSLYDGSMKEWANDSDTPLMI